MFSAQGANDLIVILNSTGSNVVLGQSAETTV